MTGETPFHEDPGATALLRVLRDHSASPLTGVELRRVLHITRGSLLKRLRRLREAGCVVEGHEAEGVRLSHCGGSLRPEVMLSLLPAVGWGRPYHAFASAPSTNDLCHVLAREGAPEGTVVTAEEQWKGRGRLGRPWHLPKGKGLAFSLLLRPPFPPNRMALLTLAAAVGVCWAMEELGAKPGIKWPNDVELDGRKVCGILTEAQADPDRLHYAVVGVGVNVEARREDFPEEVRPRAVALSEHIDRPVGRDVFFAELLGRLREAYGLLVSGKGERLLREWRLRSTVLGRQVRVRQGERTFFGQALDVDAQGALLLRTDWGFTETVTAGDVDQLRLVEPGVRRSGRTTRSRRRL